MRLNHLSAAEMVSLSQPLLDPNQPAHKALSASPELQGLLPRLQATHDALLGRQLSNDTQEQELQRELAVLGAEHGDLARGIDSLCSTGAVLGEEGEQRAAWLRLQKQFLPEGLNLVRMSYSAIGGHALLLQKRLESLTAADKKLLKSQLIGRRSAYDLVQRFVEVGLLIARKEQERPSLLAGPTPGEIFAARQQWARTIGAMLSLIEMAGLSADQEQQLVSPIRAASLRAERRRKIEEPAPAPLPPAHGPSAPVTPAVPVGPT
jgi:hypothetical protein